MANITTIRVVNRNTSRVGTVVPTPGRKGRKRGTVRTADMANTLVKWDGEDSPVMVPSDDLEVYAYLDENGNEVGP